MAFCTVSRFCYGKRGGGQLLSAAALLIGFGAWRVHNPPERWAARCIALFGGLTLTLAPLLYMAAFVPGGGGFYGPVTLFVVLDAYKANGSFLLSGLLWFAAARLIVVYDKTLRSPAQAATRTTA